MEWVFDVLLALCLVLTMIAGARAGFFRELFALLGVAAGIALAMRLAPLLVHRVPPPMKGWTILSILAFLVVFLATFALLRLTGSAFAALWEGKEPGGLSRVFGLALGAVRGALLVLVLVGAVLLIAQPASPALARSRVLPWCRPGLRAAARLLPPGVRTPLLYRLDALHAVPRRVEVHDQV